MLNNSFLRQTATTIVFIDSSVSDYQTLQTGIVEGVEAVILSPNQNGIEEITDFLQQHPQITTIHIVSHGSPGCLYLGNGQLNLDNISKYADLLPRWQSENILLYGCNVAAGDAGEEFIRKLHEITNATISASATKTGNAALGGNWELEVNIPVTDVETFHGTSLHYLSDIVFRADTLNTYQGVFALTLVGEWDFLSYALAVTVVGNYAYAVGDTLDIIDISNPAQPIVKGSYNKLDSIFSSWLSYGAKAVQVVGNYAYVADFSSGLQIIDISNPTNPTLKSNYNTSGASRGVQVVGNYAYLADDSQLLIIDISNPTNPTLKGYYNTSGGAKDVQIAGNYAYLATGNSGLQIIDISNPTTPTFKGNYDTSGEALGVQIVGNYAYVADGNSGLQIIDISNPTTPTFKGNYNTSGEALGVQIVGNYAYVADGFSGLQIIDISNPTIPILKGNYDTSHYARDVQVVGNYAYVADGDSGLQIIDISNPTIPTLNDNYNISNYAEGVQVVGNYAYVADERSGLQIIDISNPKTPTLKSNYDTSGEARGVQIVGNYAYVADGYSGLQIIDISNPTTPTFKGNYDTSGFAISVQVVGNHAYVGDWTSGLQIIDISNPTAPTFKGNYNTSGLAKGVQVVGNYAYVADLSSGLQIIDITNPTTPTLKGNYNTSGTAFDVQVVDNYVYVADADSGLQIIDISNPTAPTFKGNYDTSGEARGVQVVGNYAYVADYYGLRIIDISNPLTPTLKGNYDTSDQPVGVQVVGNYAYVADREGGLKIIDVSDSTIPNQAPTNLLFNVAFTTATNIPGVTNPHFVKVGDFNSDGKLDLAIASYVNNNVSVLLGTGTGSFGTATTFAVGVNPGFIATGDFNGDGKLDLAVTNLNQFSSANSNISVLLGTGTGGFGTATNVAVGANPLGVTVGDFNGDGKLDLAVANVNSANVSVLLGTGTGSFGTATNFGVGVNPQGVTVADFNGDGKLDLAVTNANPGFNNVSILLGTGTGSFGTATNFAVGASPYSIAVGDFNEDGKLDLVTTNYYDNNISILLGTGTGSFGTATNFALGVNPGGVTVADFNGDGKLDLAVSGSNNISLLLGTGTGSFSSPTALTVGANSTNATGGDFNGDGKLDLVTANENNLSVLLNLTSPTNINENVAANTVLGSFITIDPDTGNTFTYSLVTGTGSTDNASFTIVGNQLKTNAVFDFETKNSYSIRVKTTDQGGLSYEKQLAINISNLPEYIAIESVGNTKLVKDSTNKYFTQTGTNTPIAIKNGGQQISQDIYGSGWQTIATETVNGDNQVLWKNTDGNFLHIWHLDSNWNWVSSEGNWGLNSADAFTQETKFGIDANGDGVIGNPYTAIEAVGNTKLVKDSTYKYFTQIGTNTPIAIKNGGQQIYQNIYAGWQTIAAETVNGDNQVLWKNVSGNYLHIWHLDNNWNWVSSEGNWGLNSADALTQETKFAIDANGDGVIGNPYTAIESAGNTKLVKDSTNKYFTQIGTNTPIAIKNGGQQISQDIYGSGWQTIATETVNGDNQVLWKNVSGNYLHIWHLDSNWNWVSSEGNWGLNSAEALNQETVFGIDANGDGKIGYAIIESAGNTTFLKDAANKYFTQTGTNTPIAIKNGGQQISQDIYGSGWQTLAAETVSVINQVAEIVSGVNQVLWKNVAGNFLHIWHLDSNWNWVSSEGNWGLNSAEALTQETKFGIDANGDGKIGSPSSLTLTGTIGNDILISGANSDTFNGGLGNDTLYLGLNDNAVDNVNYASGDGTDTVYQFVRGVGGDKLNFTGIANLDVVTLGANTEVRIGDGIAANTGFGTGQLLITLSSTTGLNNADVNVNLFGSNFLFN